MKTWLIPSTSMPREAMSVATRMRTLPLRVALRIGTARLLWLSLLLTALALWIKPLWFAQVVVVMAIAGGVLTLCFAAWHFATRRPERPAIPYGVAISGAGLWALASQYLPALQNGGLFG